jgi:hypothetical protein
MVGATVLTLTIAAPADASKRSISQLADLAAKRLRDEAAAVEGPAESA